VFKRIVDILDNGAKSIRPMKDVVDLKTEAKTNNNGEYSITVPLDIEPNYFMVTANIEGYEEMISMFVVVEKNDTANSNFELTKNNLTNEELILLEKKGMKEKIKNEIEKAMDYQNINEDNKKKVNKNAVNKSSLLSCNYNVPIQVCVSNLINGYNSCTGTGCSGTSCTGTNCILINFDDYVAGVVQGEIGFFSGVLEAKKAQAVAARTFSLNRYNQGLAVNCGQAYNSTISATCSTAAAITSTQVILYDGNVIDAKYSARCNGNYTQNSENGVWAPNTNCNQSGSYVAYLRSVPCSGHISCNSTTETPCCETTISTANTAGYLFGHGVGMCQRGIQDFASQGKAYDWLLQHYYTGICIANTSTPQANATITNISVSPTATSQGSTDTLTYTINSTESMTVLLGASFTLTGTSAWNVSDPTNDTSVSLVSGTQTKTRNFVVPFVIAPGTYDLLVALWSDNNGNNMIDGTPIDALVSSLQLDSALTIGSSLATSPVEIVSFAAKPISLSVELDWQTATEINNYGFEIERKNTVQQTDWIKIGFVEGAGTSNAPKEYIFTDRNITMGRYAYRLKQIDRDGKFEYHGNVEVVIGPPQKFALQQNFPNPYNPSTTISYSVATRSHVTLTVFNALGQKVAELVDGDKDAGVYEVTFDASGLASGVYLYRMESGSFVQTKKLVVVK
jgi:peptidoglycan hydrolase-like amidase